jgi:hypothetical protein
MWAPAEVAITITLMLAILAGTCAGAFISGVAGFGFALVALNFWVWCIDPHLLAPLAVFGSVIAQITSLGAVRRGFEWRRVMPFLIGGALGVPVGVWLCAGGLLLLSVVGTQFPPSLIWRKVGRWLRRHPGWHHGWLGRLDRARTHLMVYAARLG